jgi:hypothetical protein
MRNQARATLNAQMTRQLGLQIGYNNVFWDYDDEGGSFLNPSRSGLLDRMEHLALVNLRWQVLPETTAIFGYNYGAVQFNGDETIGFLPFYGPINSSDRDSQSHYIYGGVDQNFGRNFTASLKVGGTYVDYDNDTINSDGWMPYADVSLSYTYATASYVQVGYVYTFNQTDVIAPDVASGTVTSSQQSGSLYALVNHQFTPRLAAMLHANYQDSTFEGGAYDSSSDKYFTVGLNLTYMISRHFSCEAGYSFDNLDSDIPGRGYDRNRVFLGVTASY